MKTVSEGGVPEIRGLVKNEYQESSRDSKLRFSNTYSRVCIQVKHPVKKSVLVSFIKNFF